MKRVVSVLIASKGANLTSTDRLYVAKWVELRHDSNSQAILMIPILSSGCVQMI